MSDVVAVIGCGLLGSAVARLMSGAGNDVLAWNRTPARARALSTEGVTPVERVGDAVSGASLALVTVTTYADAAEALEPVGDWDGRTVVVLTTGVPGEAKRLARSLVRRGAAYLDGAVLGYPRDLGNPATMVVFSGPRATWTLCERTLLALGGASRHVSDDVSAANVIDVAVTGAFYTVALGAFTEAAAYATARGLHPEELLPAADAWIDILRRNVREAAAAIASDEHETDQATLDVYLEAATSWRQEMVDAHQRATLMAAEEQNLAAAQAAGLGRLGFFAQSRTARDDTVSFTAAEQRGDLRE